jgi:dienelactone hydrolase
MAEVLLFHHARGLTPGCLAFAEELRDAGHVVHVPDLFDGRVFDELPEGVRYAEEELGFDTFIARGQAIADSLPAEIVYGGFSLGVLPAQMLAQTRPAAQGALLLYSAVPPSEFGGAWPAGIPLQIHMMERDEFALEGDLDAARELAATVAGAQLFEYPGDRHLFADSSLPDYDEAAAKLLMERVLGFLERIE